MTEDEDRTRLQTETKRMLLDPARRIELDELVTAEVSRIVAALNDDAFGAGPLQGSRVEVDAMLANKAIETWEFVTPFCASLKLAARYGSADDLTPWVHGVRTFVEAANHDGGGIDALNAMRHVPASFGLLTAGIATVAAQRWTNLRVLVDSVTVQNRYDQKPLALLEATDPFQAFRSGGASGSMLAYAASKSITIDDVVAELGTERHMTIHGGEPMRWAAAALNPLFADLAPNESSWDTHFIRAEVMLGLLAEDANIRVPEVEGRRRYRASHWFGLTANRRFRGDGGPLDEVIYQINRDGSHWPPLVAGLFGGSVDRATAAMQSYAEGSDAVAKSRPF